MRYFVFKWENGPLFLRNRTVKGLLAVIGVDVVSEEGEWAEVRIKEMIAVPYMKIFPYDVNEKMVVAASDIFDDLSSAKHYAIRSLPWQDNMTKQQS
jgi:hypothetical protein